MLLVGGGKMGGAMLAGWRERGLAPSVVIDPAPAAAALAGPDVAIVPDASAIPPGFRPGAVVLAVKPQIAAGAIPPTVPAWHGAVALSIMAGKTLKTLADLAGSGQKLVRAMPNTPAAIRQGITVATPGPGIGEADRTLCHALLEAVGDVEWVEDEALLDPVTAVSGSGPAYVFLLAELLERAGVHQGLPAPLARRLARATTSGAGALLAASAEDAADLRTAVTSPGGTTQAALEILMRDWPDTLSRAVAAATARSRELGR